MNASLTELPTGTVTLLLTDIEGSTRLWETQAAFMNEAMTRHDEIFREVVAKFNGRFPKDQGEGDSVVAGFSLATDAVACAVELQRRLHVEPWAHGPEGVQLRVRMALHSGEIEESDGNYKGVTINRCARIRSLAYGGQTLISSATHDLVVDDLPPGTTVRDLGSHRLKDLSRPEGIFQLVHADFDEEFPPLRSMDAARHNLPEQLTSFIGREDAMQSVIELLSETRLLTLMGAGGAGKTRLSLHVAADLLDDYPCGVWFVDLAPVTDPVLVPQALATAMRIRGYPGRSILDGVVEEIGNEVSLVLLDNCEHVIAQAASLADELLRRCPNLKILATSRETLGVPGETTWRIPSLALPQTGDLPAEALEEFEAIRLFVDRAANAKPGFKVSDRNAPAILEICRRLDGIPLAIELAAARVQSLSPEQIADRLNDRFRLLSTGSRTVLPRQQTLRELVDWSYRLLSEPEQVILRRLAVFAGGFTLEAAEEIVCGGVVEAEAVLDLVSQLVNKSLVLTDESDERTRYRMLETIREFGQLHLRELGELPEISNRHLDWYAALAERIYPKLHEAEQGDWLDLIEVEHDNIHAALAWSLTGAGGDAGLRLAAHLRRFWRLRGYWQEGRRALQSTLARSPSADIQLRALAHFGIGSFASSEADFAAARFHFEEAIKLAEAAGDSEVVGWARNNLAEVELNEGDFPKARALLERNYEERKAAARPDQLADALMELGRLSAAEGDRQKASDLMAQALTLWRRVGNQQRLAEARRSMAFAAGDLDLARAEAQKSLDTARDRRDKVGTAKFLQRLARVAMANKDQTQAMGLLREALQIQHELGDRWGIGISLVGLADAHFTLGDKARAATLFAAADAIRDSLGLPIPPVAAPRWQTLKAEIKDAVHPDVLAQCDREGRGMSIDEAVEHALVG